MTKNPSLLRSPWASYLLVAAVAVAVQAYQLIELADDPSVRGPIIDGQNYHMEAASLAAGQAQPWEPHFQSPIFSWTLALVYRLSSPDPFHGLFLQALLAVLIALAVLALSRLLLSPTWAVLAGLCACLYGPLLFFCGQLIPDPLAAASALALLYLAAISRPDAGPFRSLLLGLGTGLSIAVRGTIAPFLLWLLYRPFRSLPPRRAGVRVLAIVCGALLGLSPVALSNWRRAGEFSLLTSNEGVNLYVGNNPNMRADTAARPGYKWDELMQLPARHGVIDPLRRSDYYNKMVLDWALGHPLDFIKGIAIKSADLLNGREIPRNLDPRGELGSTPLVRVLLVEGPPRFPFGIVLPLAVLGFAACLPGARGRFRQALAAVFWFVCLNAMGIVAFFPTSRYRLGPALALLPVALLGVLALKSWLDKKSKPRPVAVALALVALLWANLAPTFTGPDLSRERLLQRGWAHISAGKYRSALQVLEQDVQQRPDEPDSWRTLGQVRDSLGDREGAIAALVRATDLAPRFAHALQHLGALYISYGRYADAAAVLERCVKADPGHPLGWVHLARAYVGAGDWQSAVYSAQRATEVNPAHGEGWLYLGIALRHTGEFASAEPVLRRAMAMLPKEPNPSNQLARCLAAMNRTSEAIELLRQTVARWPRYEPARKYLDQLLSRTPAYSVY
jgi:Flp pilus assembly protein TadD/4-amino-4-deoxy-L-arabinose transferase-like glycosyltransferase